MDLTILNFLKKKKKQSLHSKRYYKQSGKGNWDFFLNRSNQDRIEKE